MLLKQFNLLLSSRVIGSYFHCSVLRGLSRKDYEFPVLNEAELEETLTHGDGPGGQKVNKAFNAVRLLHKPTGITVKCHETRSVDKNKVLARERLLVKVDNFLNGENSFEALNAKEELRRRLKAKSLKAKKMERKKAAKEKFSDSPSEE